MSKERRSQRVFSIHRALLYFYSPYHDKLLNGHFAEGLVLANQKDGDAVCFCCQDLCKFHGHGSIEEQEASRFIRANRMTPADSTSSLRIGRARVRFQRRRGSGSRQRARVRRKILQQTPEIGSECGLMMREKPQRWLQRQKTRDKWYSSF